MTMEALIDITQKKEALHKQNCFTQLTPKEIDILATLLIETNIKPGTTIVTEGEYVDSVFLIIKGTADVRHVTVKDGALHVSSIATLKEGDSIGLSDSGFYSLSGVRTATVVANTPMVVLKLSVAAFHGFALAYPHVSEVMRSISRSFLPPSE
jgi:CRP-like cAMP-binding protein